MYSLLTSWGYAVIAAGSGRKQWLFSRLFRASS